MNPSEQGGIISSPLSGSTPFFQDTIKRINVTANYKVCSKKEVFRRLKCITSFFIHFLPKAVSIEGIGKKHTIGLSLKSLTTESNFLMCSNLSSSFRTSHLLSRWAQRVLWCTLWPTSIFRTLSPKKNGVVVGSNKEPFCVRFKSNTQSITMLWVQFNCHELFSKTRNGHVENI